jgi:hypothetical protein
MPIEMYGADEAGHLMLLPDPTPERTPGQATAPPDGEPPLPGADSLPTPATPPRAPSSPPQEPPDDLAALRRLIEAREAKDREREVKDAQRDAQLETTMRFLRGEELPTAPATPAAPPARPDGAAFTSQDDYLEALADWKAEQKLTAFKEEQQQAQQVRQQQQASHTREQAVRQAEDAFVNDHPDYVEVVTRGLVEKTPQAFRQLIMLQDDAPAVAYALAKDEALLGRLLQMPPPQLLYALGRLSGQNGGSASPPGTTEPAPSAGGSPQGGGLPPGSVAPTAQGEPGRPKPPPPRPLSGTGVAPVGGYRDDMSMAEYRQWKKSALGA